MQNKTKEKWISARSELTTRLTTNLGIDDSYSMVVSRLNVLLRILLASSVPW